MPGATPAVLPEASPEVLPEVTMVAAPGESPDAVPEDGSARRRPIAGQVAMPGLAAVLGAAHGAPLPSPR